MSLSRSLFLAGLDALPFAALASIATYVFARTAIQPSAVVGMLAATVGVAVLLALGTISANRYRANGKSFYFTRAVVVEGLLSIP
ncbi:hypothetical protein BVU17_06890 [Haloarcula taiwanensis]|uniref:Uncharacterized protein n=1 Tax=Haloarcula taiwanensis TaxID=1932004 RepID=A0A2H4ZXR8_9EURY|nr:MULTISPECIES: hypothetical protein [Haloarcula]AUG47263.1 hypothetical protein BVU17_06890 [Haloarcula taiwanensis]RLM34072.1 hypothetical protein DVK01_16495 [Haloarcula sp. Atlit-120R]RLM42357.1 hypothetical protein DVK00_14885 [Haloarcula sp. Atlit-47R]